MAIRPRLHLLLKFLRGSLGRIDDPLKYISMLAEFFRCYLILLDDRFTEPLPSDLKVHWSIRRGIVGGRELATNETVNKHRDDFPAPCGVCETHPAIRAPTDLYVLALRFNDQAEISIAKTLFRDDELERRVPIRGN